MKRDGSVPVALYYSYDEDGRRTRTERDQVGSRFATYFGYDDASRLVSEEWVDGGGSGVYAFSWEYDAAGNRALQVWNGTPTYYDYNVLNELTREVTDDAHRYYVYNDDGHLAQETDGGGTTYFSWASDDRLRRVRRPDGEAWTYRYVMGSQRWRKRHDDVEELTDFVYDGEKVAEEIDYDAANQATYTHAGSSIYSPLLAQRTGGTSGWFLQDALGSTLGLLDSDEALLLQVMYDAWGNELLATGSLETPYRYVGAYGYYRDVESDLLYLWHRYHDPATGRFIRRDPVRMAGLSAYGYVRNQATGRTDPSGLQFGGGGGMPGGPPPGFGDPNERTIGPNFPPPLGTGAPPPMTVITPTPRCPDKTLGPYLECLSQRSMDPQSPCWAHWWRCRMESSPPWGPPDVPPSECDFYTEERCRREDDCVCSWRTGHDLDIKAGCHHVTPDYPKPPWLPGGDWWWF